MLKIVMILAIWAVIYPTGQDKSTNHSNERSDSKAKQHSVDASGMERCPPNNITNNYAAQTRRSTEIGFKRLTSIAAHSLAF
jgi:hypothetical protein